MNSSEALQAMDGLLLGDGCLQRYKNGARFVMHQSKHTISLGNHLRYLQWIADNVFKTLNIPVSAGYPRLLSRTYKDKPYPYAALKTRQSFLLADLYDKWYSGGEWVKGRDVSIHIHHSVKILPGYLLQARELSTLALAHWFLGDGGNNISNRSVRLSLATCCFSEQEVQHLTTMLNKMLVNTIEPMKNRSAKSGSGLTICLSSTDDNVNLFIDLIESHILEIFGYSDDLSYKYMLRRGTGIAKSYSRTLGYPPPGHSLFTNLREALRKGKICG